MSAVAINNTLIDAISSRVKQDPQGPAFVFLTADGQEQEVSNEQFYRDLRGCAFRLADRGIQPGEIILLALDHGYDLLICFWGAVYCGAIPSVLTYWRFGSEKDAYVRKVGNMAAAVRAQAVITLRDLHVEMNTALSKRGCRVFASEEATTGLFDQNRTLPELNAEQIALMQFTSGTTSAPKAIQFSHRAVLDHVLASARAYQINKECVYVSWLPFYHDMGLIGHIRALIHGGMLVCMSPQKWIGQPELLLQAVSRYRGTMTNMPNFAFDYCVQRIRDEELAGVDLSSWRILSNGSEYIMLESMQRFGKRFSQYGFTMDALAVGYGMAENVMGVSATIPGEGVKIDWISTEGITTLNRAMPDIPYSADARAIASCGYPYPGVELAILDEEWEKLPDRQIGEIAIRTNTLFQGYYLSQDENEELFHQGWFRTGDMGYLVAGELYVCGRKKDLIIVGGRNIQPQAIERIASDVFGGHAGLSAAFGVINASVGTETAVLILEQKNPLDPAQQDVLIAKIRKQVLDELDIALSDVRLVPKGWVVKTTSGKIARDANRKKYIQEGFHLQKDDKVEVLSGEMTREQIQKIVTHLFEEILGAKDIGPKDDFLKLGGDSLSALRLLLEIEQRFGKDISAAAFFQHPTVESLVVLLSCESSHDKSAGKEATPWWNAKYGLHHKVKSRLSILFRGGLKGVITSIRLKLAEMIPAWLFDKKWAKPVLGRKRVRLMRRFHRLLENPMQNEEDFMQCALACHVPYSIRKKSPQEFSDRWLRQWSLDADLTTLQEAYRKGTGVILVCWHSHFWINRLVKEFTLELLRPNAYSYIGRWRQSLPESAKALPVVEKERLRVMLYLDQLMKAKSILTKGGIISILPDGYGGSSLGLSVSFHGRRRSFRGGFAELAIETGADVIPVSLDIDACKRKLTITSLKPLDVGGYGMPHVDRVEGLLRQYVAYFKQQWACCPGLVPSGRMRKHIG